MGPAQFRRSLLPSGHMHASDRLAIFSCSTAECDPRCVIRRLPNKHRKFHWLRSFRTRSLLIYIVPERLRTATNEMASGVVARPNGEFYSRKATYIAAF